MASNIEDGGDISLRNVGCIQEDSNLHNTTVRTSNPTSKHVIFMQGVSKKLRQNHTVLSGG
jgi:hypothetical protein